MQLSGAQVGRYYYSIIQQPYAVGWTMVVICMEVQQTDLKQLEVIQNQCLRIALGTRKTTPIISMQVEANVPPLDVRRNCLALKYYHKILDCLSNCPIVKEVTIHRLENQILNSFYHKMAEISIEQIQNVVHHRHVPVYSDVPPWCDLSEYIKTDFQGIDSVGNLSDMECTQLFNEMTNQFYRNYVHIYTDGTKTIENTGASLVVPSINVQQNFKLHPDVSILTAELYGIERALIWLEDKNNFNYVICTDSLTSLVLINSRQLRSYREQIFNIQERLQACNQQRRVQLQWIPAHRGIPGNGEADRQAKQSKESKVSERIRIPLSDRLQMVKKSAKVKFKEKLRVAVEVRGIGSFAYRIKDKIEDWEHVNHKSRSLETAMARLRMGHVALGNHLFHFQLSDNPLCACGQVETVEHFLLNCTMYMYQRQVMMNSLQTLQINSVVDIKLLLGGSKHNIVIQRRILAVVHRYLLATGRLKTL